MARSTVYNVGETKAIFCKGKNLPEIIQWYSPQGERVEERSTKNNRVSVERKVEDGNDLVPLIIQKIKLVDGGNWTCKAGDINKTIEFIVGEKVVISDRNVTMEGEEGSSVKLTCKAHGVPPPVVSWYKDRAREAITSDRKKYNINTDHTLEIKKLNHADVGVYVCRVRQKLLSHYTDKTVHLSVHHKPVLYNNSTRKLYTSKVEEVYAIINETKNITCSAFANPPPVYRWFRRNNYFDDGLKTDEDPITEEDTVVMSEDGLHSILILRVYDEDVIGEYKCTANNTKGQESIIFHVSLGLKPNPPDFVELVGVTMSSLTFNVTCSTCPMQMDQNVAPDPQNLTIIGYTFQLVPVKEQYPPDWDQAQDFEVDIEDVHETLFTVAPLANDTKYHGRICSRNSAGISDWMLISQELKTNSAVKLSAAFTTLIALFITLSCCL